MYAWTRHNVGWMVIDRIAGDEQITYKAGKGRYLIGRIQKGNEELILLKPLTFMNLSGIPVSEACNDFGIDLEKFIVVLDDVNLSFGQLRLRRGGTDGGHNGLASVIYHLVSEEFPRLRIGIGQPEDDIPLSEYVLLDFSDEEKEKIPEVIDKAASCIDVWRREGIEVAMNVANRKMAE